MEIPDDVHERILGITAEIVNASDSGNTRVSWGLYGELREYCDSVAAAGKDHPFLWETLADFTTDDRSSIDIYQRALALAHDLDATEYQASICLALAERHFNLGELSVAYDHAARANDLASRTDDLDLRRGISQFLLDHSGAWAGT